MSEEQAEPRRVLVAEDEGLIRLDIVETLTQAGFEVVGEAADGEEAVELALELEPDLCVMDVKMPNLSLKMVVNQLIEHRMRVPQVTLFTSVVGR